MLKNLLKFGYLALAIVLGAVVGFGSYYINVSESATSKVKNALADKDYVTLSRIYSGSLIDGTNIAASFEETNSYDIYMNAGVMEQSGTYYNPEEDGLKTVYYHNFDMAYYIYLTDISFLYGDANGASGKTVHYAGIKFTSDTNTYNYYFDVNDSYNTAVKDTDYTVVKVTGDDGYTYNDYNDNFDGYCETQYSEKELLLNSKRNLSNFYTNYGFLPVSFSSKQIYYIEELLGGDITSFAIINSQGEKVSGDINYSFDFDEQFFLNAKPLFDAYSKFIPIYDKYGKVEGAQYTNDVSDSEYEAAVSQFNKDVEEFAYKLQNKALYPGFENYYNALPESYIKDSSIVFKTIMIVIVYIIAAVVLYFLFFHLKDITNLVFNRNKGPKQEIRPKNINIATKNQEKEVIDVKEENNNSSENNN